MNLSHLDDDKALRDLEELSKEIDFFVSNELSDESDKHSDSLPYSAEDDIQEQAQELIAEIDAYLTEASMSKEEDDYLDHIQKLVDSSLGLDSTGKPLPTSRVLDTFDENVDDNEIDKVFREILAQEGYFSEPVDLTSSEDDYLEALANELKECLEEDTLTIQDDVYTSINELYPYLDMNFIRSVYDCKEDIANAYPLGEDVVLLHRISFVVLDELRQFVEIVLDYNYRVNVDEDKMIVDVIKDFNNEDGKILANIFDIANQAQVLNGKYEGYRVEIL